MSNAEISVKTSDFDLLNNRRIHEEKSEELCEICQFNPRIDRCFITGEFIELPSDDFILYGNLSMFIDYHNSMVDLIDDILSSRGIIHV